MELQYFAAESEETAAVTATDESSRSASDYIQTGGLLKGMGVVIAMTILLLPLLIFMDKKTARHRDELEVLEEMSKKVDENDNAGE